ncbi:transposon TX1, partial [Tanacetum coccineum]
MFFNYPDNWSVKDLWKIFKGYRMVFDIYMVGKKLKNGQKFGFVRFKNIADIDFLYKRLCSISFGSQNLKVFDAHERKQILSPIFKAKKKDGHVKYGGGNGNRDERSYMDVLKNANRVCKKDLCTEDERKFKREIVIKEEDMMGDVIRRAIIGEKTRKNVVENTDHGIRRWLWKIRRADALSKVTGRFTWVSIMEVPIAYWKEGVFKNIARRWGEVMNLANCSLNGSQSVITGRVLVHTSEMTLIDEVLLIRIGINRCKVIVKEEVSDIVQFEIKEFVKAYEEKKAEPPVDDDMESDSEDDDDDNDEDEDKNDTVIPETVNGVDGVLNVTPPKLGRSGM